MGAQSLMYSFRANQYLGKVTLVTLDVMGNWGCYENVDEMSRWSLPT